MATIKVYPDGAEIIRQGEADRCMYVVRKGKVRIFRTMGATETTLAHIAPGGIFGEMALFEDLPRSASAKAVGETEVQTISQTEFAALSCDPIVKRVLDQMAGRLRRIDEDYEHLSVDKHRQREFLAALPLRHDYDQYYQA